MWHAVEKIENSFSAWRRRIRTKIIFWIVTEYFLVTKWNRIFCYAYWCVQRSFSLMRPLFVPVQYSYNLVVRQCGYLLHAKAHRWQCCRFRKRDEYQWKIVRYRPNDKFPWVNIYYFGNEMRKPVDCDLWRWWNLDLLTNDENVWWKKVRVQKYLLLNQRSSPVSRQLASLSWQKISNTTSSPSSVHLWSTRSFCQSKKKAVHKEQ